MKRLLLIVLVLSFIGCSDNSLRKIEEPPEPPPPPNPQLEVYSDDQLNPMLIDYGNINVGNDSLRIVTLESVGDDAIHINDIKIDGSGGFAMENLADLQPLLQPGESWELKLAYRPEFDESAAAQLVVRSNDVDEPEHKVTLFAEGLAPVIEIHPLSFSFGDFEIGCYNDIDIFIGNVGRAPLEIIDIWLDDTSSAGEFLQLNGVTPGTVILPNGWTASSVLYEPVDVIADFGQLHVESNDPLNPDVQASLTGMGHYDAVIIDTYLQEGNNQTDILWVVDNSCSMYQEQNTLAANFSSFVSIIQAQNVDYQIGVVSTDVGDSGALQGSIPIITPATPDPAQEFGANVNLGTHGSAWERGMDSAWLALQPGILAFGGLNAGFLRPLAGLRIIFVSDENDSSNSLSSVPAYVSFYQSLKSDPAMVVTSDITGGATGCQGAGGNAGIGGDYIAATNLTGGISASICDSNWSGIMNNLAWMSVSLSDVFSLTEPDPIHSTIVVYLDGIVTHSGWVYDALNNAIIFDMDHIPPDQTQVDIEYAIYGDCTD
jgi:hypothetical protein